MSSILVSRSVLVGSISEFCLEEKASKNCVRGVCGVPCERKLVNVRVETDERTSHDNVVTHAPRPQAPRLSLIHI